ncbi:hypothetical protein L1987_12639 [Smallanthus sonchifolius]|uniref:Uncharacterized protein n=1 Tax=Smallanthus sonchifolius TaxID=185202 RepID=A0ACB9JFV6_9ASTR|nr:hypothetical protein L1987_12639 [Smallanthus sonchifolius]
MMDRNPSDGFVKKTLGAVMEREVGREGLGEEFEDDLSLQILVQKAASEDILLLPLNATDIDVKAVTRMLSVTDDNLLPTQYIP